MEKKYLIAEYSTGPWYRDWHLYLCDSPEAFRRNRDGSWGWISMGPSHFSPKVIEFLRSLGIDTAPSTIHDNGGGIAEFARRYPLQGLSGGKERGGIKVIIDDNDNLWIAQTGD